MARKKHAYHYIYKITCTITGNYYIGMHSCVDLEDGYMGSGKRLGYSKRKYGLKNHIKEILEFLNDRESLAKREAEIVNEEFIQDPLSMNLKVGGTGGWNRLGKSHTPEARKLISEKLKDKTYEEIHGIESANLERDKRRQSVKNHWANMSDKDKADRVSKNIGKRYHHKNVEELKECPYCKIKARASLLKRWHLDNCKSLTKI